MGRVAERSKLAGAEYLAWERLQPVRHEFFDGEVFAMAGVSLRHNVLCVNLIAARQVLASASSCPPRPS